MNDPIIALIWANDAKLAAKRMRFIPYTICHDELTETQEQIDKHIDTLRRKQARVSQDEVEKKRLEGVYDDAVTALALARASVTAQLAIVDLADANPLAGVDPAYDQAVYDVRVLSMLHVIMLNLRGNGKRLAYIPGRMRGWEEVLDVISAVRYGGYGPAEALALSLDARTIRFIRDLKMKDCDILLQYSRRREMNKEEWPPYTLAGSAIASDGEVSNAGDVLGYHHHCDPNVIAVDQEHVTQYAAHARMLVKRDLICQEFGVHCTGILFLATI